MSLDPNLVRPATIAPVAQPAPASLDLAGLLAKYQAIPTTDYGSELKLARASSNRETEAFNQMLQKAMTDKSNEGPSKAEMYFRLASAFGAPTKTGNFMESFASAGKTLADYSKESRDAELASASRKLQLGITAQQAKMTGAKEELRSLQTLAGEEMKDARASQRDILKLYLESGKPQSEAGKVAADMGLKAGTPAYSAYVDKYVTDKLNSGDLYKQAMLGIAQGNLGIANAGLALRTSQFDEKKAQGAKLSPGEMKLKSETEEIRDASDQALADLKQAYKLNENSFDTSLVDLAQRKVLEAAGSKDIKLSNTREMENLLSRSAVGKLKSSFGGNPTEGERKILLDLEGIGAKSVEERNKIMKNAYSALKIKREQQQKRLNEISQGLYRDAAPASSGGGLD